jgi:HD-GYP domain-containing protein (c-di-GMP phosphodiesterase class II)
VVRLTDLIRGAKELTEGEQGAKEKKSAEQAAAPASPPAASPPPAQPVTLRVLKEHLEREASALPSEPQGTPVTLRALVGDQTAAPSPPPPVQGPPVQPPSVPVAAPPPPPVTVQAGPVETAPPKAPVQAPAPTVDWYAQAEAALTAIAKLIRQGRPFVLADVAQIANGFVASLSQDDRLLVRAISHQSGPSLVGNMVHTAIYTIKIGMGLGYRKDELSRVALAALLHDVGMFRLPEQLLEEPGRWSQEQIAVLQRHPQFGEELLKKVAPDSPWLAEVVGQEHERLNGTGYPRRLQGPQIHEFAFVIGLADILDAMLRSRLNRQAMLPFEAVRLLLVREKASFPTKLFKSLLQQFSLFPVGTWVKLTSGEVGEVVRLNPRFPLRPTVKVMIDQGGQRLREPREIDISATPLVHVAEIVDRVQLAF